MQGLEFDRTYVKVPQQVKEHGRYLYLELQRLLKIEDTISLGH